MLDELRSHATSFGAKLLLAVLVMAFGIWGVGDMIRHPASSQTVATVGNKTISLSDYQRSLRREKENVERALGEHYSPDMVQSLQLPQRVLRRLINDELIRMDAESLDLMPSDSDVVRRIRSNPAFQDSKGNFDKTLFDATLRNSGQSEKSYVDNLRQEMASSLVVDTLTSAIAVPTEAERTLYAAQQEQRTATFYIIGSAQAGNAPVPDDKTLASYYKEHMHEFSSPEYRTISYTSFKSGDVRMKVTVSDDELHKAYAAHLEEFKKPERRTVDQLLYTRQEEAQKAYDAIQAGTSFDQLAKTSDIINKTAISLGTVERGHIVESAEDAVFALQVNQVTKPIQSPFGWHIFRVSSIQPPSTESFEDARPSLEKDLKEQAQENSVSKLSNSIEDALASGSSLQEATKDLGLAVSSVGPVDHNGKSPDGTAVKLPDFDKFVDVAFKTDEKSESSITPSKDGVYYILRVDSLTPEHARPLEDLKSQVIAAYQKDESAKHISTVADEIAAKLSKKDGRDSIIATYHLSGVTPAAFKRTAKSAGDIPLSAPLVEDIFSHSPGDATAAFPAKGNDYVVAVIKDVVPVATPDSKGKALDAIHEEIANSEQDELYAEYMHYLAEKYNISINNGLIAALDKNAAE